MNKFLVVTTVLIGVTSFAAKPAKTSTAKPAQTKVQASVAPQATTAQPQAAVAPAPVAPQAAPTNAPASVAATERLETKTVAQTTTSTATIPSAKAGVVTGTIDLRPSYGHTKGEFHTENYADLGYKKGDLHLMYRQEFATQIHHSDKDLVGHALDIQDGYFRFKVANIWNSSNKVFGLNYELRPYLPTWDVEGSKGMITKVRNYFNLTAKVSDTVKLTLSEVPIPHFYTRSGNGTSANSAFQNRVYVMLDWDITDKWSLNVPVWLSSTRYRTFSADAKKSGSWQHGLLVYPELDYALTSNYTIGLSWYNNDSLLKGDLSGTTLSEGFKSGVTQAVFRATL